MGTAAAKGSGRTRNVLHCFSSVPTSGNRREGVTSEVRCLVRKQNTGIIVCNSFAVNVASFLRTQAASCLHVQQEKSWEWLALDCSGEEPKAEQLAVKFEHSEWPSSPSMRLKTRKC